MGAALIAFVAVADPYGLRAGPGHPPGPIVDTNQRWSYPQLARGGAFDAAVFGTSTARLLDPTALDAAFGVRFANLAMNAATPDEQLRLATLFVTGRTPRFLLFGLDAPWCAEAPPARTAIPFPDWLYDSPPAWGILREMSLRSVVAATKAILVRAGRGKPAIRGDGFAVFTPPESQYDLARARAHLAEAGSREASGETPEAATPALDRLDAFLSRLPQTTQVILAFMPVHIRAQGRAGTPAGAREAICKDRTAALAARHGATVVDFRIPSPVTTDDANYWDALHYRLPVGAHVVAALKAAAQDRVGDPSGTYTILAPR